MPRLQDDVARPAVRARVAKIYSAALAAAGYTLNETKALYRETFIRMAVPDRRAVDDGQQVLRPSAPP